MIIQRSDYMLEERKKVHHKKEEKMFIWALETNFPRSKP